MTFDKNLNQSLLGVNFTHDGQSRRAHLVKDDAERAPAIELWLDVELDTVNAEQLAVDLQTVIDRYRARASKNQPRYLVHLAAVRI